MSELRDRQGLTEEEFLRRYNPDKYPKPSLTADIIIVRESGRRPEVLLVRRGGHPYLGCWALPGGFSMSSEALEETAARELLEETGVEAADLRLTGVYSKPGRDPRGWVVSAAYAARVPDASALAGDDADAVTWAPLDRGAEGLTLDRTGLGERLAFDHDQILSDALRVLFPEGR